MDGVFGGTATAASAVAAVHLGSLAEHTRGCFLDWEKERAGSSRLLGASGVRVREVSAPSKGDVTFMSRQTTGLWVGLGV